MTQSSNPIIIERKRLYRTQKWKKMRLQILARDPICQICHQAASEQADHIVHDDQNSRFFDPGNLRGTCAPCNNRRGASERGRKAHIQMENNLTRAKSAHINRVEAMMANMRNKTND